ncbi:MAG: protein-L-isoaspartate(D-aspartate) O-methyltransferase [Chloroflexi bacterium]|nr:protein-L-isoaspartate(D-aspartate) O-methyltransferase [Chloroflexota bacterium]
MHGLAYETARQELVRHLSLKIKDSKVLCALAHIPRERFVPPEVRHLAYEDRPLPIGLGQTISQPYIVALMAQALELSGSERVLEVGTGSGYQAAILAELSMHVVTVERLPILAEGARRLLLNLGYGNVEVHLAEETVGWKAGAPYDAIIVAAGAPCVPDELLGQLVVGGRMCLPVGTREEQDLVRIIRKQHGISRESLGACRFVPLISKTSWQENSLV